MGKVEQVVSLVLAVVVAGLLVGHILPVGLDAINSADTASWTSAEANIYDVLGIFLILTILVALAGWAVKSFKA